MYATYTCIMEAHLDVRKLRMHIEGAFKCTHVMHAYMENYTHL